MYLNLEALWSAQVVYSTDCEDCKAVRDGKLQLGKKYASKPVSHMSYTGRMFIDCEGCMAGRGGKLASLKGKGRQILRNLK